MFAAMKTGATWTPPPQEQSVPVQQQNGDKQMSNSGGQKRRPQVKVFNIPDGTEQVI